ncbi:MAG: type IV pilus modification protein PilV [Gammaproteobacteria bacterium]|nr:type IV pilus modification protein PilV [Gammaproteobacteria bacterium]
MSAATQSRRQAAGFTLIEVLIAVVVFAIGLLGIAGLQVAGMRFSHGSQLRSVATMQAENMADHLRANRAGVLAGAYNQTSNMPTSYSKDCDTSSCTSSELATFHLVAWNSHVANGKPKESNADMLPSGTGTVCIDSTPNDGSATNWRCDNLGVVYAIKVVWTERTAAQNDLSDANGDGVADVTDTRQQLLVLRAIP